jgi:hypothetical protein
MSETNTSDIDIDIIEEEEEPKISRNKGKDKEGIHEEEEPVTPIPSLTKETRKLRKKKQGSDDEKKQARKSVLQRSISLVKGESDEDDIIPFPTIAIDEKLDVEEDEIDEVDTDDLLDQVDQLPPLRKKLLTKKRTLRRTRSSFTRKSKINKAELLKKVYKNMPQDVLTIYSIMLKSNPTLTIQKRSHN